MPRLHHALDELQLGRWLAAKEPIVRADGDGLTFTLSEFGTATWVLRYRRGSRRRELTLGNYPDLTLSEARKRARAERVQIDIGKGPAADKKQQGHPHLWRATLVSRNARSSLAAHSLRTSFENDRANSIRLLPVLIKVTKRGLNCSH